MFLYPLLELPWRRLGLSSYMTKIFLPFSQLQKTAELSVLPHKNIGYEFHFFPHREWRFTNHTGWSLETRQMPVVTFL